MTNDKHHRPNLNRLNRISAYSPNRLRLLLVSAAFALFGFGCGKSENSQTQQVAGSPSGYATTPQPCNVQHLPGYHQGSCDSNGNIAQQFGNTCGPQGCIQFPYQPNWNSSDCGCPFNTQAVVTPHYGVACVPVNAFAGHANAFLHYQIQPTAQSAYWNFPQNTFVLNIPQSYNNQIGHCLTSRVVVGCSWGSHGQSGCPVGSYCQRTHFNQNVGRCVRY